MSILIKQATILHEGSRHHLSTKDILIDNGKIEKIASRITAEKSKLIESENLHVSPGWVDIGTMGGEPGFEHRESFESLSNAAASGGFTGIAVFPNTKPIIDNKSSLQFIINNSRDQLVNYFPIGAISKRCEGEHLTEMMDMHYHGAIAFSDGQHSISSNGLLLRALQYVKSFKGLIIHQPDDPSLSHGNSIHEGIASTHLGLKGSPALAEVLTLERDILMANYAESRLLVHKISSRESLDKLKDQLSNNIHSSVAYLNLVRTDENLLSFDANYKCSPPLRSEADRIELINAINNGVIKVICSNHLPLEDELKKVEFLYAEAGAIGLQTCYSALNSFAGKLKAEKMIASLSTGPREILGLPIPELEKGANADLTLFDPQKSWRYTEKNNASKSKNSPFLNHTFNGAVVGIINGKKSYFNSYD